LLMDASRRAEALSRSASSRTNEPMGPATYGASEAIDDYKLEN